MRAVARYGRGYVDAGDNNSPGCAASPKIPPYVTTNMLEALDVLALLLIGPAPETASKPSSPRGGESVLASTKLR